MELKAEVQLPELAMLSVVIVGWLHAGHPLGCAGDVSSRMAIGRLE